MPKLIIRYSEKVQNVLVFYLVLGFELGLL